MTTQHTQGRLTLELVESDSGTIRHLCPVDKDGLSVLTVVEHEGVKFAAVYLDDDARRLVACWNACEGISTESLEKYAQRLEHPFKELFLAMEESERELMDQRNELLEALKSVLNWIDDNCETTGFDAVEAQADAAIAKAEGSAA